MADLRGKEVKGYILEEMVNDGGFGAVYRAYQPVIDREVAIKVILPQYANHPDFIRGFEFEARLVARVEHPHIIPLYDFWREPDGAYLVMRWLRGGNLREALTKERWDITGIVRIFDQISEALTLAHQQGVVHRDIKPDNILLDQQRNAFLTDFGIARDLVGNRDALGSGALIGSPPYLSPEQILRKSVTPQSDIYSLGIVLYEILTGKLPFSDPSVTELLNQHVNDPMPSLYELRPDLPLAVNSVIWRATAKEPRARYPNAIAFAEDFRQVVLAAQAANIRSTGIYLATHVDTLNVTDDSSEQVNTIAFDEPSKVTEQGKVSSKSTDSETIQLRDDFESDGKPVKHSTDTLRLDDVPTDTLKFNQPPPSEEFGFEEKKRSELKYPEGRNQKFASERSLSGHLIPINPYKGLRPFEEVDAQDFFGRDVLVRQIIRRMMEPDENSHFLALIGPSGSGKSSVIKAGLIPALRQGAIPDSDKWFIVSMVPGAKPFDRLTAALLTAAVKEPPDLRESLLMSDGGLYRAVKNILPEDGELLLFIDQFEEVFTLIEDEKTRVHFLNSLAFALNQKDTPLRVIVTLRADYYDRPLLYTGIGELVRTRTEVVLPLRDAELEQAILHPAERVGLALERGLIAAVIADIRESPGGLPLLQYTMTEVFERRNGNRLTLSAYRELGGVSGALARRADDIYNEFDEARQQITRQLFLRMVAINESGDPTRRRVFWTELTSISTDKDLLENVINLFTKYRLITRDHDQQTRVPTVEVAHEALIRAWDNLQMWIENSREDLRIQRRLATATREWQNAGRDPSFLASGARLEQFESLSQKPDLALTEQESTYLTASVAQRTRNRARLRLFIASLITFAVIAFVLALFAFDRQTRAVAERDRADLQSRIARSGELAVISVTNRDQVDLALLLSLEALNTASTFEARNSLVTALQDVPHVQKFLHGHEDGVRSVAFSPDGDLIVSGSRDFGVRLWQTVSGQQVNIFEGHTDWVNAVAFSPDGTQIASGGNDNMVRLWDVESGAAIGEPLEQTGAVWSVAFNGDGTQVAVGNADATVSVWDVESGERVFEPLTGHSDFVYAVTYSPDNTILASAGADATVQLWSAETGEPLGEPLTGHTDWIFSLSFSPDGNLLASADIQNRVILWDVEEATILAEFNTNHTNWIRSIVFSPDGQLLVTASADNTIRVWDASSGRMVIPPLTAHRAAVWDVDFHPDGRTLVSAGEDAQIILWDITTMDLSEMTLNHSDFVEAVAYHPEGHTIAAAGGSRQDFDVRLWDATSGELLRTLDGHLGPVTDIAFSAGGQYMATSGADLQVIVWSTETYEPLHASLLHESIVWDVAFNAEGTRLASASEDGDVMVWDVASGVPVFPALRGHEDSVTALAFSPDGNVLTSGGSDGQIILWNAASGTQIGEPIPAHTDEIMGLAFSPNGTQLASASRDGTIKLWNPTTRELLREPLTGHTDYVVDLAFSPNGTRLASASHDGTFILWDVEVGRGIGRPFSGHSDWVNAVDFSPDGRTLVTASRDMTVRLWELDLSVWRARACTLVNRNFTDDEWTRYFRGQAYHQTCEFAESTTELS